MEQVVFALVFFGALGYFAWNVRRLVRILQLGKKEDRSGQPGKRLQRMAAIAFGQSKLLREPFAGILHFCIFWGFVILLTAVGESIVQGFAPGFSLAFLGPLHVPLLFLQDVIGAIVVAAVVVSLLRRLFAPPPRLDVEGHARWDAALILVLILVVMLTMFGQNAAGIALRGEEYGDGRIISAGLSGIFDGASKGAVQMWYTLFFWAHVLVVLVFLNYLPFSKHLHVLTSIPNVYCSNLGPTGALAPVNLADETAVKFGAADVEDFTWKQLLNGYTCTECGRCSAACPAQATGKLLDPKKIFVDLRARTMEKAEVLLRAPASGETERDRILGHQLLDNFITEQELWACTTCMACVQECPVMIEHVDAIVEMRRGLVLNESRFPDELKTMFSNLERNFTPWAFGHASRADWAEGLDVPLMADVKKAELLYWVGCAGSYDARYQKVSRAFVRLLKMAGVDFAILGTEEKCTGDPARRAGNEYLAQTLMAENIATLNGYGVKKIVVTCPHCLQALGKEYAQFGGEYTVVHHSELLRELIQQGRLTVARGHEGKITFHDPCYLGRYHGTYDAPRDVLGAIPALTQVEMKRSRDRSFCCGAGGARMWMEEREGKRINIERTEEALATGAAAIGTGCPFCMTMISDGVKEKNPSIPVEVKDIAELLLEAVERS
jgi:Fe-S oxidoreductase/nitrate reductase gamma subunit